MTTIQGSISKLVDSSKVMLESLGYVSTNIANYNTNCYKATRFETFINAGGVVQGVARIDQSAGDQVATFRELDVAIEGTGYIPVTSLNGEVTYTRGGSFGVNAEGYIVSGNNLVGSGIQLPTNYERIKIEKDGSVLALLDKENTFKKVGKIPLVTFRNPEGLEVLEGNKFKATNDSGKAELALDHTKINQGKIEKANYDPYAFINDTLALNASIISSSKFIKILDNMYRESINLR